MKRLLVVDDERPVVDTILHIVKRDLGAEFDIAGTASSGREAIERASALGPDIVLMDVRMPGLSGLDAVRELRRRGSEAVFILVTAYERFDIAREAVELGVQDYLLKPVAREALAQSLRAASTLIDRRGEFERREVEYREREERIRLFVETAFLHAVALGEAIAPQLAAYRQALSLEEPLAVAAAAAFSPPDGSSDAAPLHERFREILRYKSKALAGPLLAGLCVLALPLKAEEDAESAMASVRESAAAASAPGRGLVHLSFGTVRPLAELGESWAAALRGLWGAASGTLPPAGSEPPGAAGSGTLPPAADGADSEAGHDFEDEEAFLGALLEGSVERSRAAFERILDRLRGSAAPARWRRFRLLSLLGSAYRTLARRGLLGEREVEVELDMAELLAAPEGGALELALRTRFARIADRLGRIPHRSAAVTAAISYITRNFGGSLSLETAAETVGLSPNRLSRLFVEETGRGFSDFLIQYRIERAKEMLLAPGASIKLVSAACGYPDPNYFSRLFKKVTGSTPTSFSSGTTEANDAEL
ncbi:MAG TPA: response regulator [Rectinemataceae bacterium]|nr:response regulator [Rectinemataceae bacterium]